MKQFIYLFLFTSASCFAQEWSLSELIQQALKNNPQMREAEARIEQASAQTDQFHAAFFPQLSVGSSYSKTTVPMLAFGNIINQRAYRNGIDFNRPGTLDNLGLQAGVQYNLYRGGSDRASLQIGKYNESAVRTDRETVRRDLAYEVVRAYYNIRQAQETLSSAESAVTAAQENVRIAKLKHDAGTLLREDVLKMAVHLAQVEEERIKGQHTLAIAEMVLVHLLGLKKEYIQIGQDDLHLTVPKANIPSRSEVESLSLRIKALEAKVAAVRGGAKPTVDVFANGGHNRGWHTHGNGSSWSAGVAVNWTVFDGKHSTSLLLEAMAALRALQEQKRTLDLALDLEAEQARLGFAEAQARLEVTEKMLKLAEETATLSRNRYASGTLLTSDLIATEDMLTNARMRHAIAQNYKAVSLVTFKKALGEKFF